MDTPAVITLVVATTLVWGGMVASVVHAVRASRQRASRG